VSGLLGGQYELGVWNPRQIDSVEGAKLVKGDSEAMLSVQLPENGIEGVSYATVTIRFAGSPCKN
jgi:hypothetical protein